MIGRIIAVTLKSIALILLFALGLALTFTGLFFIGIPLIILCIWLYVRLIKKERMKTREIQAAKRIEPVRSSKKTYEDAERSYSDETPASVAKNRGNPVADAAASYMIGKAVSDKLQADYKQRKKHFTSSDSCATCEYWAGERIAKKQNYYKGAECPDRYTTGSCGCKGGPYYRRIMMCGSGACKGFERWKNC